MPRTNEVALEGVVVSDISLRKSKEKEIPVVDFRMMHKEPRARNAVFIDVEVWGDQALDFSEEAERNSIVCIDKGQLRRDVWEKDGEQRSKLKITAQRIRVKGKINKESG